MNFPSRLLLRLLITVLFIFTDVPGVHAEKRIGVIMTGNIPYYAKMHEKFVAEINKRFAGTDTIEIVLQRPFPDPISWSNAARKLIAFDVDLIVTYGSSATQAVIYEKSHIPVVYSGVYDPEHTVTADKNVTGCGFKIPLSSILRYFKGLKTIKTICIVCSSTEEDSIRQYETIKVLAEGQNINAEKIDIRSRDDLNKLETKDNDAVFITGSSLAHLWLDDILSILRKRQVPTADIFPDYSESGVLMTLFHPYQPESQMTAEMASQILLGEDPVNIVPHTFRDTELVFNLVEAKNLGISFPIHLLIEATRVIK